MPEIKVTTTDQAIAEAIARLEDARETAKNNIDFAVEQAIANLQLREAALADVDGLVSRAKHVYVRDHEVWKHDNLPLGGTRIRLTNGQEVVIVDEPSYHVDRVRTFLEAGKTYRFWLLVEEVKP